jgi:hypothetical protein
MRKINCKECGIKFHYCSSCDYDPYASRGYCSYHCWEESGAYKKRRSLFLNFYNSMQWAQKQMFCELFNSTFADEEWDCEVEKWLKEEEDRGFVNAGKDMEE